MRIWPALAAVAALAAWPASALGVSRPSFAHSYRGTISGKVEIRTGGSEVHGKWTIAGLVFRLTKVQAFEGGFTGLYKVTAGTVAYSETETGDCSYSTSTQFGLARALPRPNPSTPLALDVNPLGHRSTFGLINVNRQLSVTESCPDPDGGPASTETRKVDLPTLFDAGETSWSPGRHLRHTRTQKEDNGKESWSWNLRPRR